MRKPVLLAALGLLAACSSQRVTAPVTGEPVCADFELGAARTPFKGALEFPVKVAIYEGDDVVTERLILGKRKASDKSSKLVVTEEDEQYDLVWSQCSNPFAPRRATKKRGRTTESTTSTQCGEAKEYKRIKLKVKEGDVKSRTIAYLAPPKPACLKDIVPAQTTASASASAAASAAPKADTNAKPDTSAAPKADTNAKPDSSAAPKADANAKPDSSAAPKPDTKAKPAAN